MRLPMIVLTLVLALIVGGCSFYPLPQDTTGDDTHAIISKVRCEAEQGLFLVALQEIRKHAEKPVYVDNGKTYSGFELAHLLEHEQIFITPKALGKIINRELYDAFKYYSTASIGYEFTLDLSEINNQGISADFLRSLPSPGISLAAGGGVERTRQIQRIFRIVDNLEDLFPKSRREFCDAALSVDIVYPLRGANPIHDLIRSFIYANEFSNLRGTTDQSAVNQMADTIEFTTTLSSKLEPTITPNIVGPGLRLSSLALANQNSRTDRHKVIITLSVAPKKDKEIRKNGQVVVINTRSSISRSDYANKTIDQQREKNFQDAVVQIGTSISQLRAFPLFGF